MNGKSLLAMAAITGAAGGILWGWMAPAAIPPASIAAAATTSADERESIEASVTYGGCNEVRALGRAPLHIGEPGYRTDMDSDGDGLACEPIR